MTYKPELSDTTFTIKQLFEEVNSRVHIPPFFWGGQPEITKGDNCDCVFCRRLRREILTDLYQGMHKENCHNFQHRMHCEKHNRFYHPEDDACEECREAMKPKSQPQPPRQSQDFTNGRRTTIGTWNLGPDFGAGGIST